LCSRPNTEDIRLTIKGLAESFLEEIPKLNKFLLEINLIQLTKSHIKNQQYWVIALQAAITAGQQSAAGGGQAKRIRQKVILQLPSRTKLVITARRDANQMHTPFRIHTPFPPT
jgi:hypothetical protein